MPTASELTRQLAESNATEQWVDQVRGTIFNGDADGFERLARQLDDLPASARRLFVTHARRTDLMHQAVVNGTTAMVQRLVPWSNLRLKDDEGQTALMRAVGVGNLEMVQALRPGSRTADRDNDWHTALGHALTNVRRETPDDPIVAALWETARLADRDRDRNGLLHQAVESGGAYVPTLLEAGLDANLPNRQGLLPLMRAAMPGQVPLVPVAARALCAATDPRATDEHGATAFLYAVGHGVQPLIDALWATSDRRCVQEDGRNALHLAVRNGMDSQALVQRLLDDGVNPHHLARHGKTPLQASTLDGPQAVFDTFLAHASTATMGRGDPGTDLMAFVLTRTVRPGWEPEHPFTWDRFTQVLERYDRAALLERLDMLVQPDGSDAAALLQARLPAVFALYEAQALKGALGTDGPAHGPARSRVRL